MAKFNVGDRVRVRAEREVWGAIAGKTGTVVEFLGLESVGGFVQPGETWPEEIQYRVSLPMGDPEREETVPIPESWLEPDLKHN